MGVLTGSQIRDLGIITPHVPRSRTSRGISFGESTAGYDVRIAEHLLMNSHERFALGSLVEFMALPHDIIGFVKDKSSWARTGLSVSNSVIEPGWEGHLTVGLTYQPLRGAVRIHAGDPIAQVVFMRLERPTSPYQGAYQGQTAGVTKSVLDPTRLEPQG